jgi:CheY-like chemotaxis protein
MLVLSHQESLDRMVNLFRAREPMVDVIGVETSEKALEFAMHHAINAMAVDEHMGDMSGAELVTKVKELRPEITAMIMTSPSNSELHEVSRSISGAQCVDKTANLEQLVTRVASGLFRQEVGFRGLLDNLELPEIIQLLCLRQETKEIRITSGPKAGIVMIENGQVVHARTQSQQGEAAFYDLFCWKGGGFQLKPLGVVPKRTIQRPWESLLMEAGRLLDEQGSNAPAAATGPATLTSETDVPSPTPAKAPSPAPGGADEGAPVLPGVVVVGTKNDPKRVTVYDIHKKDRAPKADAGNERWPAEVVKQSLVDEAVKGSARPPAAAPRSTTARPSQAVRPAPRRPLPERRTPVAASSSAGTSPGVTGINRAKTRSAGPGRMAVKSRHPGRLKTAAAWCAIVVMSIPTVMVVAMSVPWMSDQSGIVAHLESILPDRILPLSLGKSPSPAAVAPEPLPMPTEWADAPGVCEVRTEPLEEFNTSGNVIALAAKTFDALNLGANPWVELTTPSGVRMGAVAQRKDIEEGVILIRRTMAWALGIDESRKNFVKVEPVELTRALDEERELAFTRSRPMAESYCESWYAVGIGLSVMKTAQLTPGSYAIAKGPEGYQSVRIQVMDRGNPDEIWLSGRVREAIGALAEDDKVVLYPRRELGQEPAEPAAPEPPVDDAEELVVR